MRGSFTGQQQMLTEPRAAAGAGGVQRGMAGMFSLARAADLCRDYEQVGLSCRDGASSFSNEGVLVRG